MGKNGLETGMNKVCFICYILWYNSNLKPLLKGGVPKSCKEVFKFGPRRMSTGGLNNKRYNIVFIVTPLRWREAGGEWVWEKRKPARRLAQKCPRLADRREEVLFSPDFPISSPTQWELFKSGFTMRSNPGLTVTPATLTGSGTSRTTPGLEWGQHTFSFLILNWDHSTIPPSGTVGQLSRSTASRGGTHFLRTRTGILFESQRTMSGRGWRWTTKRVYEMKYF